MTGIALTKLDGTAKGGVVIGISDELKIPVTWVGVGEKIADLRPFDPHEFVEALFEPAPAPVGTGARARRAGRRQALMPPSPLGPVSGAAPGTPPPRRAWGARAARRLRGPPAPTARDPGDPGASRGLPGRLSPAGGCSPPTRAGATARPTTGARWCSTSSAAGRTAERPTGPAAHGWCSGGTPTGLIGRDAGAADGPLGSRAARPAFRWSSPAAPTAGCFCGRWSGCGSTVSARRSTPPRRRRGATCWSARQGRRGDVKVTEAALRHALGRGRRGDGGRERPAVDGPALEQAHGPDVQEAHLEQHQERHRRPDAGVDGEPERAARSRGRSRARAAASCSGRRGSSASP